MFKTLRFILLSLISLTNLYSDIDMSRMSSDTLQDSRLSTFFPGSSDGFSSVSFTRLSGYVKIGNDFYRITNSDSFIFNITLSKKLGKYQEGSFFSESKKLLYFYDSSFSTAEIPCYTSSAPTYYSLCSRNIQVQAPYSEYVTFSYYKSFKLGEKITCQPNENFNTKTKQCQSCPEGHSWDAENNRCYKDCSDVNKNKWGWTDGTCTDCSKETTDDGVSQCYCKGIGSSYKTSHVTVCPGGGSICITSCDDGSQFNFKKPNTPDIPKPDNNNTTPSNPGGGNTTPGGPGGGNGGPGGGSGGPGGGNGNDGNNNGPGGGGPSGDNEFCKKNPNDPKCKGLDGDNEFCKKNPKDPKCKKDTNSTKPKGPGGGGPSGDNDGKDKDAKFNEGDFDDGGADKERDGLFNDIKNHLNNNISKLDVISEGVNQFMDNVKGKGFDKVKADIKHKCPITREIPLPNGSSKPVTVDYCDIVSPVSEVTYYAFYIGFSVGGFLLFLKLLLLSF